MESYDNHDTLDVPPVKPKIGLTSELLSKLTHPEREEEIMKARLAGLRAQETQLTESKRFAVFSLASTAVFFLLVLIGQGKLSKLFGLFFKSAEVVTA